MKLVSKHNKNCRYEVGNVVELLRIFPRTRGDHIDWVKIIDIDFKAKLVKVKRADQAPITGPADMLDCVFCTRGKYIYPDDPHSTAEIIRNMPPLNPALAAVAKASQLCGTELKLHYALAMAGCKVTLIDGTEVDAILAGLALLREAIPAGLKFSYDSVAGQCWTNGGEHDGLGVEAVQVLADRLNHGG